MFAVIDNTIQHFPAQNIAYFINGNFDFYTDEGEKIEKKNLETAVENEIKANTIGDADTAIKAYRSGEKSDAVIPYKIFSVGKVNSDPLENLIGGANNG